MDSTTFNGYLQEAKNEFKGNGIVPTQQQLYELALQKIKTKYDRIICYEFNKLRKLANVYIDDLEKNLKYHVDVELFDKLQSEIKKELEKNL